MARRSKVEVSGASASIGTMRQPWRAAKRGSERRERVYRDDFAF